MLALALRLHPRMQYPKPSPTPNPKAFPGARRVADLACGHGLLSWALLLLDDGGDGGAPRTAVAVDKRMPPSAEAIADVVLRMRPELQARWHFVESGLEAVDPAPSTLLCGVHACGGLSDAMVNLAIRGTAPLALAPCCHTHKILSDAQRARLDLTNATLADLIDDDREAALRAAGYCVKRELIPEAFTLKNRLILAAPPAVGLGLEPGKKARLAMLQPDHDEIGGARNPRVPVSDDAGARETVALLAGRAAADLRKQPTWSMDVSLWLPDGAAQCVEPAALGDIVAAVAPGVACAAGYADGAEFLHPNGRRARTFRLVYTGVSRERAKEAHAALSAAIPGAFPGSAVR
mmetsp:Transcript_34326/g.108196  ORF Transcript_34326/g.108196 Transcript_34326/m.108196 type:complete len:349 (-) Transcript_34326:98-1144(-)